MPSFRRNAWASAAALLVSMISAQALAQDETSTESTDASSSATETSSETLSYIGLTGSYLDLDKKRFPKDGTGINAFYGRQIGGNWFWEAQLLTDVQETDVNGFTDFYRHAGGLDLVYSLNERRTWSPFLLLGIGGDYTDVVPDSDDKWAFFANAGLGLVSKPMGTYGLRFRAEARYVYDDYKSGNNDFRYSAGIEIPLSPYDRTPVAPVAPPAAEPVSVVRTETLADSDGDGVPDAGDKCPGTPQGMPVDGVGCGLSQVITLTGVNFDFNKASLTPDSRKILEEVALKVKHFADVPMELEGHTDSIGSDSYNQKLSDLRANSVREFLIEQGVPGDKLTAKGLGESHPVADNGTDAGRALNRRVELHIAGQQAAPSVPVDANGAPLEGAGAPAPAEAPAAETAPADAPAPAEEAAPVAADEAAPL
ncbi:MULTISPECIES: OmpA family protein [Hydrocarboniphaga]|jgi:OOP family OmpA-OmpF porin|uniref:OmpA family protein n=1 Tax=Hydrocarboniphaga TaxID=243627 RepID=UPI0012FBC839|nr:MULTISPECIES: OmpA family protein [Hydrocarboniphaga]MDZ4079381.1 OmpA family protein [Hydrocarboniphaga sp.]